MVDLKTVILVGSLPQPEAYIANVAKSFDGQGNLTSDSTKEFLTHFSASFVAWIEKNQFQL